MVINNKKDKSFISKVKQLYKTSYMKYDIRNKFLNSMYNTFYSNKDFNKYFNLSITNIANIFSPKIRKYNFLIDDYLNSFRHYRPYSLSSNDYLVSFNVTDELFKLTEDEVNSIVNTLYKVVFNDMVKDAYKNIGNEIMDIFKELNPTSISFDKIYDLVSMSSILSHDRKELYIAPFITFNLDDVIDFRNGNKLTEKSMNHFIKLNNDSYVKFNNIYKERASIGYSIFSNSFYRANNIISEATSLPDNKDMSLNEQLQNSKFEIIYKYRSNKDFTDYPDYKVIDLMPKYTFLNQFVIGNLFNSLSISIDYKDDNRNFIMYPAKASNKPNLIINRSSIPIYKHIRSSYYDYCYKTIQKNNINENDIYQKLKMDVFRTGVDLMIRFESYINKDLRYINTNICDEVNKLIGDSIGIRFRYSQYNNHIDYTMEPKKFRTSNFYDYLLKMINKRNSIHSLSNLSEDEMLKEFTLFVDNYIICNNNLTTISIEIDVYDNITKSYIPVFETFTNAIYEWRYELFDLLHSFNDQYISDNLHKKLIDYLNTNTQINTNTRYSFNISDEDVDALINSFEKIFNKYRDFYNNSVKRISIMAVEPLIKKFFTAYSKMVTYKRKYNSDDRELFNQATEVIGKVPPLEMILSALSFSDDNVNFGLNHLC